MPLRLHSDTHAAPLPGAEEKLPMAAPEEEKIPEEAIIPTLIEKLKAMKATVKAPTL